MLSYVFKTFNYLCNLQPLYTLTCDINKWLVYLNVSSLACFGISKLMSNFTCPEITGHHPWFCLRISNFTHHSWVHSFIFILDFVASWVHSLDMVFLLCTWISKISDTLDPDFLSVPFHIGLVQYRFTAALDFTDSILLWTRFIRCHMLSLNFLTWNIFSLQTAQNLSTPKTTHNY